MTNNNWRSSVENARRVTTERTAKGMSGPLHDKRDSDEFVIRRRISKRLGKPKQVRVGLT